MARRASPLSLSPCATNPDRWFEDEDQAVIAEAKAACFAECGMSSRARCLQAGLREEYGIWGGFDLEERQLIVRRMS